MLPSTSRMSLATSLRFSRSPVRKLSSTVTTAPSRTSASTRCEPMNPAPPVTKTFTPRRLISTSNRTRPRGAHAQLAICGFARRQAPVRGAADPHRLSCCGRGAGSATDATPVDRQGCPSATRSGEAAIAHTRGAQPPRARTAIEAQSSHRVRDRADDRLQIGVAQVLMDGDGQDLVDERGGSGSLVPDHPRMALVARVIVHEPWVVHGRANSGRCELASELVTGAPRISLHADR